MVDISLSRKLANFTRRAPWIIQLAHHGYRLIQPKFSVGVVGVVFNTRGQVLLVEHIFHPRHPWGLPGGWIERAEQPYETARREIREELNLQVEVEQLLLSEITLRGHLDFAYLCRPVYSTDSSTSAAASDLLEFLSSELLDYGWFDPLDTPSLLTFHRRAITRALEVKPASKVD